MWFAEIGCMEGSHRIICFRKGYDAGKPDNKTLRTWFAINVTDQTAHVASLYAIVKLV